MKEKIERIIFIIMPSIGICVAVLDFLGLLDNPNISFL